MRVALAILFLLPASAIADDAFQKRVAPFLKKYCIACHGEKKQESRIRFDRLTEFAARDRHLWTTVHEKLSAGEMPPADEPQPVAAEKTAVLKWIVAEQRALGLGSTRRLNRREFSAAVQDLTGLSVPFGNALPGDGKIAGFDTGAEGLKDSADSLAQMLRVTRRVVDGIRILESSRSKPLVADLSKSKDPRKLLDSWKKEGLAYVKVRAFPRKGAGLLLRPKWLGERDGLVINVPPPKSRRGILRLKLVVSSEKHLPQVPNSHLLVKIGGQAVDYREITASGDKPRELIYEVQLDDLAIEPRGVNITLRNLIEMPYSVPGFENEDRTRPNEKKIPGGTGLFRPVFDRRKAPPEKAPAPFVLLHRIEIDPDYVAAWPPASWKTEVGDIRDDLPTAHRLISLFVNRAWRRPVADAEQTRFRALYAKLRKQKFSFDSALRAVFQSVLLSGPFRYLAATDDKNPAIAQFAVASRLSFLLTGSPPDDELRSLAARKKLGDAKILGAQVERLMADSRSRKFFEPFVRQWLVIGQPITITQQHIKKQDFRFARYLKESMRAETVAYIAALFKENRPARELIVSDWAMMNDSLARHYGYDKITGGHLRRVKLKRDDPRGGGVLGHAGIQSMLCWMGDNWVIYRGAWTLRHILDDPPPPPPLEVPELEPSAKENRGKTFKQLLEQHQKDKRCSVCHRSIDPLGFAFQNFDLSGRWRDREFESYSRNELDGKIEWNGKGKSRPVDAIGRLPRGETFKSFAACKDLIVRNYQDDLVRGFLKNLMVYATGRKPDVDAMAEIRTIMRKTKPTGYRLRDLLTEVVRSRAFLSTLSQRQ